MAHCDALSINSFSECLPLEKREQFVKNENTRIPQFRKGGLNVCFETEKECQYILNYARTLLRICRL